MTYSKACEILNLTTPKSAKENAELAKVRLSCMTIECPLRFAVAAQVIVDAAN